MLRTRQLDGLAVAWRRAFALGVGRKQKTGSLAEPGAVERVPDDPDAFSGDDPLAEGHAHQGQRDEKPGEAGPKGAEQQLIGDEPSQVRVDGDPGHPDGEAFVLGDEPEAQEEDAIDAEPDGAGEDELVGADGEDEKAGVDEAKNPVGVFKTFVSTGRMFVE